jgi:hypothetical protein
VITEKNMFNSPQKNNRGQRGPRIKRRKKWDWANSHKSTKSVWWAVG